MRRKLLTMFALLAALTMSSCGGVDSLIEQALFALDQCNPTVESTLANCQEAVDKADEAGSSNVDAAMARSSGRLGLARLDFLTFAADLTDLGNNDTDDFEEFRGIVATYETDNGLTLDLDELQLAKDAFGDILDDVTLDDDGVAVNETLQRAAFQLGIIQALDAFIRPVKIAGTDAADVLDIDDAVTAAVLADFLNADNNMMLGGTTEEEGDDLLQPVRENYCRCSLQDPPGGAAGFVTDCLQDLMRCELNPVAADEAGDDAGIEQDYDGDGDTDDADCAALLDPVGLDTCASSDTE